MSFSTLGLSQKLLDAISAEGYQQPTPIQQQAIPAILQGRDVMAAAQTGTGKTAGFTLPLLQRLSEGQKAGNNQVRALILTPTRELAAQVGESVRTYGAHLPLQSAVVFGGVKINPQMMRLRRGADVLIATPGRLLDLYQSNAIRFNHLEVLVLDEADRMLDMGFIHDLRRILKLLPAKRQNLLFSATFSSEIRKLAKTLVRNPIEVSASPPNQSAPTVRHWIVPVDKARKTALLIELICTRRWQHVLIFTRTKHGANRLAKHLTAAGLKADAIHGNKSQGARTRALAAFKSGKVQFLVATDIAARGLDIEQLPQVVNFDLPNVAEDYVHRIGRTGRAGASGEAVSLVSADEVDSLRGIEALTGKLLKRVYVDDFEPVHELPESRPPKRKPPTARKSPASGKSGKSEGARPNPRKSSASTRKKGGGHRRRSSGSAGSRV